MVEVKCYDGASGQVTMVDVDPTPLGDKVRKRLIRQAVLHYQAARRAGTHSTKTRSEVKHSERKPWRQKGTGRARAGDFASPLWRGGGVVFGPKPRKYATGLPRRMRREALRSALLGKLLDGEVALFENVAFEQPRTKQAAEVLDRLGVAGQSATVVIGQRGENFFLSFRNLPRVDVRTADDLNAEQVVTKRNVVLERKALEKLLARFGDAS